MKYILPFFVCLTACLVGCNRADRDNRQGSYGSQHNQQGSITEPSGSSNVAKSSGIGAGATGEHDSRSTTNQSAQPK